MSIHVENVRLVDIVEPAKRSQMMAGIKSKNTKPEMLVRRMLHSRGFRFRLHRKDLPGRPDIVLPRHGAVIFVQGCFWHGHVDCAIFRLPKSRTEFWQEKIAANVLRDERSESLLLNQNWKVVHVWECALKGKSRLLEQQLQMRICEAITQKGISVIEIRGDAVHP